MQAITLCPSPKDPVDRTFLPTAPPSLSPYRLRNRSRKNHPNGDSPCCRRSSSWRLGRSFFCAPQLMKPKPPALYIDMGARRFDPAGLSGRLIVRWEGSAAYQLYLDPLDPQHVTQFHAVAQDPPHPLSVVIRLRDSAGIVACQKELFSRFCATARLSIPRAGARATADTRRRYGAKYGRGGRTNCRSHRFRRPSLPAKGYQRFAGWDFITNFPTVDGQEDWLRHENGLAGGKRPDLAGGQGAPLQVQRLPTPIEGDDVIVGDNPLRGTVETSGGRVFWVGASGCITARRLAGFSRRRSLPLRQKWRLRPHQRQFSNQLAGPLDEVDGGKQCFECIAQAQSLTS